MPHLLSKSSIKVRPTRALVAGVIALIVCSNLALTRSRANNTDMARRRSETQGSVDNRLTAATSRFSFKLYYQILKQRTDKNTFVSPASVMLALAMTYNGADGTTRDAMARALEIEGMSLEDVNRALDQFEQDFTPENWDICRKSFRITPGDLRLPRFKVEWESKLNDALKALGMAEAFDPKLANFSQMAELNSGNNLYISEVKHKSWCEVNEEGQ
jgi:serine protease inhibitor